MSVKDVHTFRQRIQTDPGCRSAFMVEQPTSPEALCAFAARFGVDLEVDAVRSFLGEADSAAGADMECVEIIDGAELTRSALEAVSGASHSDFGWNDADNQYAAFGAFGASVFGTG